MSRFWPALGSLAVFCLLWPPPPLAVAQEVGTAATPEALSDLMLPGLWFLGCAWACWMVTERLRYISPPLFAPRPSTVQSRTLSQLCALLTGLVLALVHAVPTLGVDTLGLRLAVGFFAGVAAAVLSPFFGRFLKTVEKRALAKAAGDAPETTPPPGDA